MKEKHIANLGIKVPEGRHETPADLPKLHQNMLLVGCRGSGKGVAMVN